MSVFCFLWPPLFYLFWRSFRGVSAGPGETLTLFFGSLFALAQFFLGSFVNAGGFGFSRWVSAYIDIIGAPAALPFVLCGILRIFKLLPSRADWTNLAFLWLIPVAAIRALGWSTSGDPVFLLAVPLLWTAVVSGVGFFIRMVQNLVQDGWEFTAVPALLGIAALPLLAATAYWAFFCQYAALGAALFILSLVPALFSLVLLKVH